MNAAGRQALGAVFTFLVVAAAVTHAPYFRGTRPFMERIRLFPTRIAMPRGMLFREVYGPAYTIVDRYRTRTYDDAIILISDQGPDGSLASKGWMTWFLYPRVLVQPVDLNRSPDTEVDFEMVTPTFRRDPAILGDVVDYDIFPRNARARRHARKTW